MVADYQVQTVAVRALCHESVTKLTQLQELLVNSFRTLWQREALARRVKERPLRSVRTKPCVLCKQDLQ